MHNMKSFVIHTRFSFMCIFFGAVYSVLVTPLLMSPIFVFLKDVWIRTQSAVIVSRRATNLATHLPALAAQLPNLATYLFHLPILATLPSIFLYITGIFNYVSYARQHPLPPPPHPAAQRSLRKEGNFCLF
jgi:hypothetical protein